MSELKAYNVVASNETENYINGETNLAFEAYDADDVDVLLAEKDKEIAELKGDNERLRDESCKLTDGCLRLKQCRKEKANIADELLHQKYKRCLAMAMWCWCVKELNRYGDQDYMDFAEKWRKRWLELAEKFKEEK